MKEGQPATNKLVCPDADFQVWMGLIPRSPFAVFVFANHEICRKMHGTRKYFILVR